MCAVLAAYNNAKSAQPSRTTAKNHSRRVSIELGVGFIPSRSIRSHFRQETRLTCPQAAGDNGILLRVICGNRCARVGDVRASQLLAYDDLVANGLSVSVQLAPAKRVRAAWVCLIALVLLQAPLLGSACIAATGACCGQDHCPIAAHHHPAASEPPAMDCGHDAGHHSTKIRSCSMSCCHPAQQSAIHSVAFTEPSATASVAFALLPETVSVPTVPENPGFFSPLSPPPESV